MVLAVSVISPGIRFKWQEFRKSSKYACVYHGQCGRWHFFFLWSRWWREKDLWYGCREILKTFREEEKCYIWTREVQPVQARRGRVSQWFCYCTLLFIWTLSIRQTAQQDDSRQNSCRTLWFKSFGETAARSRPYTREGCYKCLSERISQESTEGC